VKKIYMTAAVNYGDNGIGARGHIPWKSSADMKHFRSVTMGKPCIVGYRTYLSMPYLDGRQTFIAPRESIIEHPQRGDINTLEQLIDSIDAPEVHIIGGAKIYERGMPLATHMWLTRINANLPAGTCDTFFPEFDWGDWDVIEQRFSEDDGRVSFMHMVRKGVPA